MSENNELYHYGTPRHSGRYPWGSGKDPYQRNKSLKGTIDNLRKQGLSDKEIASAMKIKDRRGKPSVAMLRAVESRAVTDIRKEEMSKVVKLRDKGYSWQAVADAVGLKNESSARTLYDRAKRGNKELLDVASDALKSEVEKKKFIDVGPGSEIYLGVTNQKMKTAVLDLQAQGYQVFTPKVGQAGANGQTTTLTVLAAPGTTFKEALDAMRNNKIGLIGTHIEENSDGGYSKYGLETPRSVDSSRVFIRYHDDDSMGYKGVDRDGVIELRRGCEDLDLGASHYAQVRIAVDGTHYLKGMAMYSDNIPKGYDIVFNTNKHEGTPKISDNPDNTVLKAMKDDPENPFGSSVVQHHYIDKNGKSQLSALNIVGSTEADEHKEGSWNKWNKMISSQFLSKQDPKVAKRQLDITYNEKAKEFEEITKLTNPIVKKKLLEEFADGCDSDANTLKAAGFPRQRTQVLLSFPDIKEHEVYAPNFKNGEEVALVRFPHAGTFEIPKLKVNNTKSVGSAFKEIHAAQDAIGINPKVASILSGADFDGDTVVVIPLAGSGVKTRNETKLTESLKKLQDFEPKEIYKLPESAPRMSDKMKQRKMGEVSNLITDMTIKSADSDEIARAVRHSMVVIDAQKHHLDWKKSYADENIEELKNKYQNNGDGKHGASTLISRAKSEARVLDRKDYYLSKDNIDSKGRKLYTDSGKGYVQIKDPETGKWRIKSYKDKITPDTETRFVKNQTKSTKMAETDDARTLFSGPNHEGSRIEKVYGDYANKVKDLANKARLEYVSTESTPYDKNAAKAYKSEVESMNLKLLKYDSQKPLERRAQIMANKVLSAELSAATETPSAKEIKKIKGRALTSARDVVYEGNKRYKISLSQKEWDAIQAGAVSASKASSIINAMDSDEVKKYATPKPTVTMSAAKKARIESMKAAGATASEIADAVGVSVSTVYGALEA